MRNGSLSIPQAVDTSMMDTVQSHVHTVRFDQIDQWHRMIVRLTRVPTDHADVVIVVVGDDHLERAVLIAEEEFMWRSPYRDEDCVRISNLEFVCYLHARPPWRVAIHEDLVHYGDARAVTTVLAL